MTVCSSLALTTKLMRFFSICFTKCFRNKNENVSEMKIKFFEMKMLLFRKHLRTEGVFEMKVKLF